MYNHYFEVNRLTKQKSEQKTEQKSRRKANRYYDERSEEREVQADSKKPSRSIYGRAAKKSPWKWVDYLIFRGKNY